MLSVGVWVACQIYSEGSSLQKFWLIFYFVGPIPAQQETFIYYLPIQILRGWPISPCFDGTDRSHSHSLHHRSSSLANFSCLLSLLDGRQTLVYWVPLMRGGVGPLNPLLFDLSWRRKSSLPSFGTDGFYRIPLPIHVFLTNLPPHPTFSLGSFTFSILM